MKIENDLGKDDIKRLVIRIAIPSMLAQFVNVLYSVVDRMYIGNIAEIGEKALAGVGVCGPIVTMISAFASLVGIGGSPLMSIKMGEGSEKEAKKKQKIVTLKEVKLRPHIEDHDFYVKMKNASKFLGEGNKVKVTIMFRGRELSHPELGMAVLTRFAEELKETASIEKAAKLEGRNMTMILVSK